VHDESAGRPFRRAERVQHRPHAVGRQGVRPRGLGFAAELARSGKDAFGAPLPVFEHPAERLGAGVGCDGGIGTGFRLERRDVRTMGVEGEAGSGADDHRHERQQELGAQRDRTQGHVGVNSLSSGRGGEFTQPFAVDCARGTARAQARRDDGPRQYR
jgi:hypothetical protein